MDMLAKIYAADIIDPKKWEDTLKFFKNKDHEIKPVPVRRAMFDKVNRNLKIQFYDAFETLMTLAADSMADAPETERTKRSFPYQEPCQTVVGVQHYIDHSEERHINNIKITFSVKSAFLIDDPGTPGKMSDELY
eukprot:scaffold235182_cov42-Attheya_sp.AAC.1